MADYYTQFSEDLVLKGGKKAVAWIEKYLGQFGGDAVGEDDPNFEEAKVLAEIYDIELDFFYLSFEWDIRSEKGKKSTMWIRSEETGNPDHVATFVHAYLKKFDPAGSFGMSWAGTCSKMRTDGFAGGALFVTAEKIDFIHSEDWIYNKKTDHDKAMKASKKKAS